VEVDLVIITQGGVTWSEWCAVADACERFGITTLFGGDHYLSDVTVLDADVAGVVQAERQGFIPDG
jgi:hypothetical protein